MHADRGLFIELIRGKKVKSAVSAIKLANNAKIDLFPRPLRARLFHHSLLYLRKYTARKSKKAWFLFENSRRKDISIMQCKQQKADCAIIQMRNKSVASPKTIIKTPNAKRIIYHPAKNSAP